MAGKHRGARGYNIWGDHGRGSGQGLVYGSHTTLGLTIRYVAMVCLMAFTLEMKTLVELTQESCISIRFAAPSH